jgi:hypothetical protein
VEKGEAVLVPRIHEYVHPGDAAKLLSPPTPSADISLGLEAECFVRISGE